MSDTIIWSSDTREFTQVPHPERRREAIRAVLADIQEDPRASVRVVEERSRARLRWADRDEA
jgi:hypothetical protein